MPAAVQTFPLPRIVYERHSAYRDVSPAIETLDERGVSFEKPCPVNLADYWDYVEAIGYEAWLAQRLGCPVPLRRFSVFITDLCNLHCDYCERRTAVQKSIDLDWLRERLPEARDLGVVFFDVMGLGEPTLLKGLPELIAEATSLGMVATVGTHGATPNLRDPAYRERLFAASPLKFRISLDSAERAEHDRVRAGTPSWESAVALIEHVVDARSRGRMRAGIFVNRVVTAGNVQTLLRDLSFYANLGVDDVQLIPIRFHADAFLSNEAIRRFNAEIAPRIEELAVRHQLPWLREIARPFGTEDDEIELSAQGRYYRPTQATECYIQKSQLLLDARQLPFTCLWARRNGGGPIEWEGEPPADLYTMREQLLSVNYLQVNPFICESLCTRRIIHANDAAARHIELPIYSEAT